jgi:hypothetical protein
MKRVKFNLADFSVHKFFPKERIKSKMQIVNILLELCRYILINPQVNSADSVAGIEIIIDKMSRVFFISQDRYYSIVFPFKIQEEDGNYVLSSLTNINIDSFLLSQTNAALNCNGFDDSCVLGFADSLYEHANLNEELWVFIKELLIFEDGYLRYDVDVVKAKEAEDNNTPLRHPANHLDLFYSNKATFKLGLNRKNVTEEFIDLLNVKTDCRFIDG